MKFTLKDYQEEAVADVLTNLEKAARRWREEGDRHAFSLTATTGAGKTVMAAAVFEALFHGDENFDFEPDPGAVAIWFSDDPSLNEQSRFRLLEASDRISISSLVVIENTFNRDKLEAGKIYFLNTQKLSRSSLLVPGHDPHADGRQTVMPDLRSFTIWDTIRNTVEDPSLTLYLVLDEAHRGMGASSGNGGAEKPTIVRRLINGFGQVPGIPVVWGVSATVERFDAAMAEMRGRATLPNVEVDSGKVQASGLLKDTIILDVPSGAGQYDTVLVRRGTDKLKESSAAWEDYAVRQDDADAVQPLMVLQVPNTPDPDDIGDALHSIYQRWPELPEDAVAHVFGDHTTQRFGRHSVPYIPPERVQQSAWVRVLVAKDAISTGWDCPRAEVMVSFRPARDRTHITQLLGRMVRTPLARRIPGNERLNSVDCLLPFFDAQSVRDIADALMSGGDGGGELPGRRVLVNPEEAIPNPDIPKPVWDKLLSLPSQSLPKKRARPVKRLTLLAHELAADGLLPDAGKTAHSEMHSVLDGAAARYAEQIGRTCKAVLTVGGKSLRTDLSTGEMSFDDFVEAADYAVVEHAYCRASRTIGPDLANTYSDRLARRDGEPDDIEESLMQAHATVAALGLSPEAVEYVEAEAERLAERWLAQYRIDVKSLSDKRQDVYRQIREMSTSPVDVDLARPTSWMQPAGVRETDGTETPLPRFDRHLLCADDGLFPGAFNTWETEVLRAELARAGTVAWYRNPSRASQDSVGIVYEEDGEPKIVRPDFVFFGLLGDGTVVADIVDPHGTQFSDAGPKLKGLARYAAVHAGVFRRIEAVARIGDAFRVLDLTERDVRAAVASAASIRALYESGAASDYSP